MTEWLVELQLERQHQLTLLFQSLYGCLQQGLDNITLAYNIDHVILIQITTIFPLYAGLFWQSPKRPPSPIDFSANNDEHMTFIISCARLTANIHSIPVSSKDLLKKCIIDAINNTTVPVFVPTNKVFLVLFTFIYHFLLLLNNKEFSSVANTCAVKEPQVFIKF